MAQSYLGDLSRGLRLAAGVLNPDVQRQTNAADERRETLEQQNQFDLQRMQQQFMLSQATPQARMAEEQLKNEINWRKAVAEAKGDEALMAKAAIENGKPELAMQMYNQKEARALKAQEYIDKLEEAKTKREGDHDLKLQQITNDRDRRLAEDRRAAERNVETAQHHRAMEVLSKTGQELRRMGHAMGSKPPPGYRWTPEGNQEAIPGGPADTKLKGKLDQETAALGSMENSLDRLGLAANEVKSHKGLIGITGLRGAIPNIPGSAAADAEAKLEQLKSQAGFAVLQAMRDASKTGGALGQVSDFEVRQLQNNLGALQKAQSKEQIQEELDKIIKFTSESKDRLRKAYNLKHGDKVEEPKSKSPKEMSNDELLKAING